MKNGSNRPNLKSNVQNSYVATQLEFVWYEVEGNREPPPPWRKAASLLSLSKFLQTKFCCSDTFCCFKACALNPFTPQFYQKSCPSLQTCKSVDCVSQCSWKYGMHCRMTALCLLCGVFSLYTCQLTSENDQNENVFILRTWPLPGVCLSQKKIFEPECKYLICNWQ